MAVIDKYMYFIIRRAIILDRKVFQHRNRKGGSIRMKITNDLRFNAITAELASRFRQYHIAYPMTRAELAEKSMVSIGTIARF